MLKQLESFFNTNGKKLTLTVVSLFVVIAIPVLIGKIGLVMPLVIIAICSVIVINIAFFFKPALSIYALLSFSFLMHFFSREIGGGIPYGVGLEALILLSLLVFSLHASTSDWSRLNDIFIWLLAIWLIISVMELVNPAGASARGWLQEIRSTAVYPLLITCLGFLAFRKSSDINSFLIIAIGFSFLATLNGIKQLHIGPSAGEQQFLDEGGAVTHVLFGQLRVFSFYSDAGQFGASQAHFCAMTSILVFAKFKWWKRLLLLMVACLSFYGMLISGTRGALFALLIAIIFAVFLSGNFKILFFGSLVVLLAIGLLKYTNIGNSNYEVYRLRTALDPNDASLNIRLINQQKLQVYLKNKPFGGGLGVIGANGKEYNSGNFLSTIEPDSYWVKVWAMYGIVGFTLWFSGMMYLLGRGAAIIWRIKQYNLRVKCTALLAGVAGIFFCSYGNEVINTMPSLAICYLSLVLVFLAPRFDNEPTLASIKS